MPFGKTIRITFGFIVIGVALVWSLRAENDAPVRKHAAEHSETAVQLFKRFDQLYRERQSQNPKRNPFRATQEIDGRPNEEQTEAELQEIARNYYESLWEELGLDPQVGLRTLDDLIAFAGFSPLTASDVERLSPDVLMDFSQLAGKVSRPVEFAKTFQSNRIASGEILSVRFFSPKTTDVSRKVLPVACSWRKLVRLKVRPESPAWKSGIDSVFVLGNIYEPDLEKDPYFSCESANNQVILTRRAGSKLKQPAYWLIYGKISEDGVLTDHSETSWDAMDERLGPKEVKSKYFVPGACQQCHGATPARAKLNVLDTDHWEDRIVIDNEFGEDFQDVGKSPWNVLFDVPKPTEPKRREQVMEVFRKLNTEILSQSREADTQPDPDDSDTRFMTRATEKWLKLHETTQHHIAPSQRGIPGEGGACWNPENDSEKHLVSLLNRFCYRCHSSVKYHVMDKAGVRDMKEMMILLIEDKSMPQDRADLPDGVREKIIELLEKVFPSDK